MLNFNLFLPQFKLPFHRLNQILNIQIPISQSLFFLFQLIHLPIKNLEIRLKFLQKPFIFLQIRFKIQNFLFFPINLLLLLLNFAPKSLNLLKILTLINLTNFNLPLIQKRNQLRHNSILLQILVFRLNLLNLLLNLYINAFIKHKNVQFLQSFHNNKLLLKLLPLHFNEEFLDKAVFLELILVNYLVLEHENGQNEDFFGVFVLVYFV